MDQIKIFVKGMSCNHCKMIVENSLSRIEGIDSALVDLGSGEVLIKGSPINLDKVKDTVENIGYIYGGKLS
jgi:copper chaperone CopZ